MKETLDDICPKVRPFIFRALALMTMRGVHVTVTDILRTKEEQEHNIATGHSWTMNSKHLPQNKCEACHQLTNSQGTLGLSHALDVAVYSEWARVGVKKLEWNASHPDWAIVGECVKQAGLRWGGDWKVRDLAHMELF